MKRQVFFLILFVIVGAVFGYFIYVSSSIAKDVIVNFFPYGIGPYIGTKNDDASVAVASVEQFKLVYRVGETIKFDVTILARDFGDPIALGGWLKRPTTRPDCKDEKYYRDKGYKLNEKDLKKAIEKSCLNLVPNSDGSIEVGFNGMLGIYGTDDSTGSRVQKITCLTYDRSKSCAGNSGWRFPEALGGSLGGEVIANAFITYNKEILYGQTLLPLGTVKIDKTTTSLRGVATITLPNKPSDYYRLQLLIQPPGKGYWIPWYSDVFKIVDKQGPELSVTVSNPDGSSQTVKSTDVEKKDLVVFTAKSKIEATFSSLVGGVLALIPDDISSQCAVASSFTPWRLVSFAYGQNTTCSLRPKAMQHNNDLAAILTKDPNNPSALLKWSDWYKDFMATTSSQIDPNLLINEGRFLLQHLSVPIIQTTLSGQSIVVYNTYRMALVTRIGEFIQQIPEQKPQISLSPCSGSQPSQIQKTIYELKEGTKIVIGVYDRSTKNKKPIAQVFIKSTFDLHNESNQSDLAVRLNLSPYLMNRNDYELVVQINKDKPISIRGISEWRIKFMDIYIKNTDTPGKRIIGYGYHNEKKEFVDARRPEVSIATVTIFPRAEGTFTLKKLPPNVAVCPHQAITVQKDGTVVGSVPNNKSITLTFYPKCIKEEKKSPLCSIKGFPKTQLSLFLKSKEKKETKTPPLTIVFKEKAGAD